MVYGAYSFSSSHGGDAYNFLCGERHIVLCVACGALCKNVLHLAMQTPCRLRWSCHCHFRQGLDLKSQTLNHHNLI